MCYVHKSFIFMTKHTIIYWQNNQQETAVILKIKISLYTCRSILKFQHFVIIHLSKSKGKISCIEIEQGGGQLKSSNNQCPQIQEVNSCLCTELSLQQLRNLGKRPDFLLLE
jgi:hypothetical protein